MIRELYEAFRSIDIPEDKAINAIDRLAEQLRINDSKLEFIKWALIFVALLLGAVLVRLSFM